MNQEERSDFGYCIFITVIVGVFLNLTLARVMGGLWDEGFFWDGTLRTLAGQIPFRDFRAYDIGQYYWVALIMKFFGYGIVAHRIGCIAYGSIGIFLSLLILSRALASRLLVILYIIPMVVWLIMFERMFSFTNAILTIYVTILYIEKASPKYALLMGATTGMITIFGRNHAVYSCLANLTILLIVRFKAPTKFRLALALYWLGGVILGFFSTVLTWIFIPGLFRANVEWLNFVVGRRSTNLPLPLPWIWQASDLQSFFDGLWFILVPLVSVGCIIKVLVKGIDFSYPQKLLLAASSVSLTYFHSELSRAYPYRLADSALPLILALVGLITSTKFLQLKALKVVCSLYITLSSLIAVQLAHPFLSQLIHDWPRKEVGGESLYFNPEDYHYVTAFENFFRSRVGQDVFIVLPGDTALYGLFGRTAPVYDTFPAIPFNTEANQQRMIKEISESNATWIIVHDFALDQREELRFSKSNWMVMEFIKTNYTLDSQISKDLGRQVFRRKVSA